MSFEATIDLALVNPENIRQFVGVTSGWSRSARFQDFCREIARTMPESSHLQFLSGDTYDELILVLSEVLTEDGVERVRIPDDTGKWRLATHEEAKNEDEVEWGFAQKTTTIDASNVDAILLDLKRLFQYSRDHLNEFDILEDCFITEHADRETFFANIQAYPKINDGPYTDDGDSAEFYFIALHSIITGFEEAKQRNWIAKYESMDDIIPVVRINA